MNIIKTENSFHSTVNMNRIRIKWKNNYMET